MVPLVGHLAMVLSAEKPELGEGQNIAFRVSAFPGHSNFSSSINPLSSTVTHSNTADAEITVPAAENRELSRSLSLL